MPHVDEGILHAYLDGAIDALAAAGELPDGMTAADVASHLSVCGDCRARLDAERAIRERAGLVLRDASLPRVDVPPFAAIAAAPRLRRARTRMLPLSWAASVLLAVGAGWWGSAQWRTQTPTGPVTRQESGAPAPAVSQDASADAVSTDGAQVSAAPPPSLEGGSASAATSNIEPDAAATARAPVVEQPGEDLRQAPLAAAADTRAPAPRPLRNEAADIAARQQPADSSRSLASTGSVPSFAEGARRLADAGAPAVYLVPNAEIAGFERVLGREQAGAIRWQPVTSADRAGIADQLYLVEGASEPVVEMSRDVGATTVRVTQTLTTGEVVELVMWRQQAIELSEIKVTSAAADARENAGRSSRARSPAAAPPPAAPPAAAAQAETASKAADRDAGNAPALLGTGQPRTLPDGRSELVLRSPVSPVWLAIRAPLPPAEMIELVQRLVLDTDPAR